MDSIALRIKELIDFKKMNVSSFEKQISVGNNSIGTIINRNSNVSGLILSKILNTFVDVSSDWLLIGKGEMLRNTTAQTKPVATNNIDLQDLVDKVNYIYDYTARKLLEENLTILGKKIDYEIPDTQNEKLKHK